MMDRIMRACTAWIHSPADAGSQYWPLVEEQFCQRSEVPDCPVVHTLTIVETNRRTSAATCRKMIPSRSSSIFTQRLDRGERRQSVALLCSWITVIKLVRIWGPADGTWVCHIEQKEFKASRDTSSGPASITVCTLWTHLPILVFGHFWHSFFVRLVMICASKMLYACSFIDFMFELWEKFVVMQINIQRATSASQEKQRTIKTSASRNSVEITRG